MQAHWDTTACIRHARRGCTESKERLLTLYTPLILSQVRRYASSFPTHADAYQTAVTAALHCIMACPLDGDKPFAYYLKAFVRQALRREHLAACRDRFRLDNGRRGNGPAGCNRSESSEQTGRVLYSSS